MQELSAVYFMLIVHTQAIITYHMDKMCGAEVSNLDDYGQISFKYDPLNAPHRDCRLRVNVLLEDLMIVFTEMNLRNVYCEEESITVAEPYYFLYEQDPIFGIPGIPLPLCKTNIPWSSFPSPVLKSEKSVMEVRFQGSDSTIENTGFSLLFAGSYIGASCLPGQYMCNNDKCIPKAAHNCDGIDWCGDQSGCKGNPNAGLIGGLCGGIGAALIGLIIGCCLAYRAKHKPVRLRSSPTVPTISRANTASGVHRHNVPVAPRYIPRNDQNDRYLSRYEQNYVAHQTGSENPSYVTHQTGSEHLSYVAHQTGSEPPDYTCLMNANSNDTAVTSRTAVRISNQSVHQDTALETGNQNTGSQSDSYEAPPPDYDIVINYRDMYKVTESEPMAV